MKKTMRVTYNMVEDKDQLAKIRKAFYSKDKMLKCKKGVTYYVSKYERDFRYNEVSVTMTRISIR